MANYQTKHINNFSQKELEALGENRQLLDVREESEYELGHINHAQNFPLSTIETLYPKEDKTYYVHCKSGKRSQQASEFLASKGLSIVNLDGGYTAYAEKNISLPEEQTDIRIQEDRKVINYSGMQCPGPIVNLNMEVQQLEIGKQIEVKVTDFGFYSDVKSWAAQTGHAIVDLEQNSDHVKAIVQKQPQDKNGMKVTESPNGTTIVLFSGELDKAIAALIIANGARAAGREVSIFFTFWGLNALKQNKKVKVKKRGMEKLFDLFLPSTPVNMPISKMNMFGLGNLMMRFIMKKKNVDTLPSLLEQAIKQDIRLMACTMSMDVMGIKKEELRKEAEFVGVGTYIGETQKAAHNLFI
ncbi:DsrE/DsrF/DrsH-like family protein [Paraliobacillus ryukyuensis]|uniref:DsrE/DsrF/DrsH-like family protein n=1 Tax=Paraliobacillus ryukyuensis TaxID=200904 RepID=UPI0009A845B0|nr:DsrE/DsrF/DrsH-like family protein [Paraliobacillus ryukyuensis]